MFAEVEVSWPYDPHKDEVYVLTSEKGGPLGQWGNHFLLVKTRERMPGNKEVEDPSIPQASTL